MIALDGDLATDRSYQAVVTACPLPKVGVSVDERLAAIATAIEGSPFLAVADSADLRVRRPAEVEIIDSTRGVDPVARLAAEPTVVVRVSSKLSGGARLSRCIIPDRAWPVCSSNCTPRTGRRSPARKLFSATEAPMRARSP